MQVWIYKRAFVLGDQILEALENGVSQWPKLEGRFPQVSKIYFKFHTKFQKQLGSSFPLLILKWVLKTEFKFLIHL